MNVLLYGGSFNPPHPAHVRAARLAYAALEPDRLIIMPAADPPHKSLPAGSPSPEERLELTKIAFEDFTEAQVSDMEIRRSGESYTSDTIRELMQLYPGAEISLVMGADMLLYFEKWYEARWLMENIRIVALSRENGDMPEMREYAEHLRGEYGAKIVFIDAAPMPMSSSDIRRLLQSRQGSNTLDAGVYARIIKARDYGARPELCWLRQQVDGYLKPKRIPHVRGCEQAAVKLARHWGEDEGDAAEAAILHDITKKLNAGEQLLLAQKYGILFDKIQTENLKLTHAITGAALSRELFGVSDRVHEAIRWHTTGKPDMSLLEKIIYMADYIEPTRDFDGVDTLRRLAYENIDSAMLMGLQMSLEDLRQGGIEPHGDTIDAVLWYGKDKA